VQGIHERHRQPRATAGSVVGEFIPVVGLLADVRDFGAAVAHVANGDDGAWLELGASIVGLVPGGDIAKAAVKGATKGTKAVAKFGEWMVRATGIRSNRKPSPIGPRGRQTPVE